MRVKSWSITPMRACAAGVNDPIFRHHHDQSGLAKIKPALPYRGRRRINFFVFSAIERNVILHTKVPAGSTSSSTVATASRDAGQGMSKSSTNGSD